MALVRKKLRIYVLISALNRLIMQTHPFVLFNEMTLTREKERHTITTLNIVGRHL